MIGITDSQSEALKKSMGMLGSSLDAIDAKLLTRIKSILDEKQLAQIASWLSRSAAGHHPGRAAGG